MTDTVERLRELEKAATPGPWTDTTIGHRTQSQAAERARKSVMATRVPDDPKHKIKCTDLTFVDSAEAYVGMTGNGPKATDNAAFIAEFRNAAPALLDVVERVIEAAVDPQNHAFGCAFSKDHLHEAPCNCWLQALGVALEEGEK